METAPNPDKTGSSLLESSSSQDRVGENGKSAADWPAVGGERMAPHVDAVKFAWQEMKSNLVKDFRITRLKIEKLSIFNIKTKSSNDLRLSIYQFVIKK